MSIFAINVATGESTRFTNYAFDSFCKGPDGKYYGVKSDGLYLLEGESDAGEAISANACLGKLSFKSKNLKYLPNAYSQFSSESPAQVTIETENASYTYNSRDCSKDVQTQRFDFGKGLRENYYTVTLGNSNGAKIIIDDFELVEVKSVRSIGS